MAAVYNTQLCVFGSCMAQCVHFNLVAKEVLDFAGVR